MHDNTIRRLRKERRMTQQQVAEHLGIDRSTYAYYESGRSKLNIDVLINLSEFYEVNLYTILGKEIPNY